MAIKRTAPQAIHQVQTNQSLMYRLQGSGAKAAPRQTAPKVEVLGISASWLYRDLLRTFLSTLLVVALLIGIKVSQVLS